MIFLAKNIVLFHYAWVFFFVLLVSAYFIHHIRHSHFKFQQDIRLEWCIVSDTEQFLFRISLIDT